MTDSSPVPAEERRDAVVDPGILAEQEEYQITDPPQPDEERPVPEPVEDPEAPLVSAPVDDEEWVAEDPRLEDPGSSVGEV